MSSIDYNGKVNSNDSNNLLFEPKTLIPSECPSNNKGHRVQITHKATLPTYDTIKLTLPLLDENSIKNPDEYSFTGRDGDVLSRRLILKKHSNGSIAPEMEEHCTTVGIEHNKVKDKTIIHIASANTYLHGDAMKMLGADEVGAFQEMLCTDLSEYIDADIMSATVSRLDSSTLFNMNKSSATYIDLLGNCIPKKVRRRNKQLFDGESIGFATKRNESKVMFYDKIAKEKHKQEINIKVDNLLRFEAQMNKKRVVQKQIGNAMFRDLNTDKVISSIVKMRAEQFKKYFHIDSKLSKNYAMDLATAEALRSANKRNISYILIGIEAIRLGADIDKIISILENTGMHRTTVMRAKRKLQDLTMTDAKVNELYDELTTKFEEELRMVA